MDTGYISSAYLLSIVRILDEMGFGRADALAVGDVSEADLLNPKARIPMDSVLAIFDAAAVQLDEPNIGLQAGYRFRVHTFTETGSVLALCGSLAQAAQINALYQPLTETIGECSFERRDTGAYMVWRPSFDDDQRYRHLTELIFAGYATTTNWLSWGFERGVESLSFRHGPPRNLAGYETVLGPEIRFGAAENMMKFNDKTVDRALPMSNPEKLAQVRHRLDFIMQRSQSKSGLRERVAAEIRKALRNQTVSFDGVAREMGMSERTLRRTLAEEGLSYRTILEDIRKSLVQTYMRDGRSLTEISQLLCYNDQSAFTRAFKKWYGVKPSDFRPSPIAI